jgi:hypothetical protein
MNSLKTINDVSIRGINAIKYARAVKGTKSTEIAFKIYGECDAVIQALDKVMSNLKRGIFISTNKKNARYLLLLTAQSLKSVVERVQDNFEK